MERITVIKKAHIQKSSYYKIWADDIKRHYPLNNNQGKGEAVFNYTYTEIVRKWHAHYNTACTIDEVAKYHEANCAETARIVYNLCLAVGIPKEDVRYVHSASKRHYWMLYVVIVNGQMLTPHMQTITHITSPNLDYLNLQMM